MSGEKEMVSNRRFRASSTKLSTETRHHWPAQQVAKGLAGRSQQVEVVQVLEEQR